ncbi:hypothetical protein [Pseudomonas sp. Marseille-QA0332]
MSPPQTISPLTIIAIFAGIIEASALASLPFLSERSQTIYTWFLVGFPFFLTILFFLTLNFNHRSLYFPANRLEREDTTRAGVDLLERAASPAALQLPLMELATGDGLPETMTIVLSGADTQRTIETHVLRAVGLPASRHHRWVVYNMDRQTRICISVDPLSTTRQAPPS